MKDGTWDNLVTMFFQQARRHGKAPFLWAKSDGAYKPLTWNQAADRVRNLAKGLESLGVEPGDRVALVSENRPEWLIADVAIMAIGAITVPGYVTNTVDDHLHILENSGAKGAIVSTQRLAKVLLPAAHKSGETDFVITLEDPGIAQNLSVEVLKWDDVLGRGSASETDIEALATGWKPDDTACIIYTSGTGGTPKGVMLHHGALLHNCAGAEDALLELNLDKEVFLSFLPLSHSYEHTPGQFFPISIGAQIYYAEGVETLATNMVEARPTIMVSVPRLYETMHARITRGVQKSGGFKEKLFNKAVDLGTRRYQNPGSLSFTDRLVDVIVDKLVRDKVRARFGGRLKAMVSGGAPLNPDIGLFFTALGLRLLQGYGQTESAPVVSVNRPSDPTMDTVGPPLIDTEVRIAKDGEILVRGELVMQGYWRNEDETRETIRDGWLHTGDIGLIDAAGRLKITDRKKDIIVNSGGDNLSPQRVEGILTLEHEIAQAMVHGDRRPHLVAVLAPNPEWMQTWAEENGKPADLETLSADPDFHKALSRAVERINATLSNIEKVRRFIIARAPFSIDSGEITPTMKIRRHVIRQTYGEALEGLYG
jgi:long-chain acyl-CoA synthetase